MDNFVARSPRHSSTGVTVEVRRAPGSTATAIGAELINLSREGFQLRLPAALEEQEMVVMSICAPDHEVDVMFPATVRWLREEPNGNWLAGCQATWQLDLDTLGELFLNEILVVDEESGAAHGSSMSVNS
jgi:PilZ domain